MSQRSVTKRSAQDAQTSPWIYRVGSKEIHVGRSQLPYAKKTSGPALVQVVQHTELPEHNGASDPVKAAEGDHQSAQQDTLKSKQAERPATKISTITKKVTWLNTPLTVPEKNRFLNVLFHQAPAISSRLAYYGMWILPWVLAVVVGVVLPLLLWGK